MFYDQPSTGFNQCSLPCYFKIQRIISRRTTCLILFCLLLCFLLSMNFITYKYFFLLWRTGRSTTAMEYLRTIDNIAQIIQMVAYLGSSSPALLSHFIPVFRTCTPPQHPCLSDDDANYSCFHRYPTRIFKDCRML